MHQIDNFRQFIWDFYTENGRQFAWRNIENSYYIVVSEIMLQQTQTHRVVSKYEEFIATFSTIQSLAQAPLRDVLSVWEGLGYYRRARYLHQIAQLVVNEYGGVIPRDPQVLKTFPGIGVATASSICAFAFNIPTVFIETNIRTVFIHSFFKDRHDISDKELMPLIASSVDYTNPREWYYALMDYGVFLKNKYTNPSRKSAHHTKQSKFEGSERQLRAKILKLITQKGPLSKEDVFVSTKNDQRAEKIITQLENEQFICKDYCSRYIIM